MLCILIAERHSRNGAALQQCDVAATLHRWLQQCNVAALQPTLTRCAAVQLSKTDELVWRDERGRTFLRTGDMGEIVRTKSPARHRRVPQEYSRGPTTRRNMRRIVSTRCYL